MAERNKPGTGVANRERNAAANAKEHARRRNKRKGAIPLPDQPTMVAFWWTRWQGSKWHLFPVRVMCKSTQPVPEELRKSIEIKSFAITFRSAEICVACFQRYVFENEKHRTRANPPRPKPQVEGEPIVPIEVPEETQVILTRSEAAALHEASLGESNRREGSD